MTQDDIEALVEDLRVYGTCFTTSDGKRIDPRDVFKHPFEDFREALKKKSNHDYR